VWIRRSWLLQVGAVVLAVLLFLFSIQLLGTATSGLAPTLGPVVDSVVRGGLPALGVGWLSSYVLLNGSVVAAVALSLFAAELVSAGQLFLLVIGSRLGAAGVVVLVGAIDYLQKQRYSLQEATSLGLLTFLVTHSIYLPAALLGTVVIERSAVDLAGLGRAVEVEVGWVELFAPLAAAITERVGAVAGLAVAFVGLLSSMRLFDRALSAADTERLRAGLSRWTQRRAVSFGLGLVVTGVSTSVAFSLGVVVPLYNRNYVTRREAVPYVMGASIGTLTDTLLVALALNSGVGVVIVLLVFAAALVPTTVALLAYGRYLALLEAVQDRLLADRRLFIAALVVLVVVPLALVAVSALG
jgi:sodium-dependent phosphate cotransporter